MNKEVPHNIDAEQSVLGSMFISKNALSKSLELLSPSKFYLDKHAKIFECMKNINIRNGVVDLTTVAEELNKNGWLNEVGNVDYLAEIIESVPSASNIDEYIKIVEDKAILRHLIDQATSIINESYKSNNDIGEVIDEAEKKIFEVSKSLRSTEFRPIQEVLYSTQQHIEELSKTKGTVTGISSGFYDLDKITSGFHPCELIIIAARPGVGKTAVALNIVNNVAINCKKTVALFNMEMSGEQLALRMLSNVGGIDGNKLKTGKLEDSDWRRLNEAISKLSNTKIYIDDNATNTVGEIRSKCRKLAAGPSGLDIVVIDYLTLIQGTGKNGVSRQQEVADISRTLKTMAMELNVPVIALSQLSRSIEKREDKKPLLSDLRESGAIEQDADIVAFLHCSDEEMEKQDSLVQFILRKHRNGALGEIPLMFHRALSKFDNVAAFAKEEK